MFTNPGQAASFCLTVFTDMYSCWVKTIIYHLLFYHLGTVVDPTTLTNNKAYGVK